MPFNAKVKEIGYLFEAINEVNDDAVSPRAVYMLEENKRYWGFVYTGQFDPLEDAEGNLTFSCTEDRMQTTYWADELHQVQLPLRIRIREKARLR